MAETAAAVAITALIINENTSRLFSRTSDLKVKANEG